MSPQCPVLIVEDDADLREMMAQLLTLRDITRKRSPTDARRE